MAIRIFSYTDYKRFLSDHIESLPNRGRGERRRISSQLNCQMSFITHVLSGEKDFNHEQILVIAKYLGLSTPETDYLVHLLSFNRAGTQELKSFYREKLNVLRKENENLKTRLRGEGRMPLEDEMTYYSSWIYAAVHMAAAIPKLRRLDHLASALNVEGQLILQAARKLEQMQLIKLSANETAPGKMHLYLDRESPLLKQMHSSWRNKMIDLLIQDRVEDLHYTNCFSVGEKDLPKIREFFVEAINKSLDIIRPSQEDTLAVMCVDLQKLTI